VSKERKLNIREWKSGIEARDCTRLNEASDAEDAAVATARRSRRSKFGARRASRSR